MKKNILLLINGFGIEQTGSYDIYDEKLMPNLDRLTRERLFVSLSSLDLDYKSGYRNFSMGITEPLSYKLIENNIVSLEHKNNQTLKYIVSKVAQYKSKLQLFCFMDNENTINQLTEYLHEILSYNDVNVFLHLVFCERSLNDYKSIEKSMIKLNFEFGDKVKIGIVTGIDNFENILPLRDIVKTFSTEAGEKWNDIGKKLEVLLQTKMPPFKARTFAVNSGFGLQPNDQILFFNYSNIDLTNFDKELKTQPYRKIDYTNIKYYSLFPTKCTEPIPFMYNFAVSAIYTLDAIKSINAKCLVMDLQEKCPYINYYMTGLRNNVDPDLRYLATDDGFIYDENRILEIVKSRSEELIIINYEIETCKTVEEIEDRLRKIDNIIGLLDSYVHENNLALVISSFYGIEKELYNAKHALCKINFSIRVPLVVDDYSYIKSQYSISEGSVHDLQNTLLKNINIAYKENGLIKKKSSLLSIFYKKPKGGNK